MNLSQITFRVSSTFKILRSTNLIIFADLLRDSYIVNNNIINMVPLLGRIFLYFCLFQEC